MSNYFLPYFIVTCLFLLMFVMEYNARKPIVKKIIAETCPIIFFLFWGMRNYTFCDWRNYKDYFDNLTLNSELTLEFEPGWVLLNYIIRFFTDNYLVVEIFATTIMIVLLYSIFLKFSRYHALSWAFFCSCVFLMMSTGLVRNGLSWMICFCYLNLIKEKKRNYYLGVVFVACIFHVSALLFVFVYFLSNRLYNLKLYWALLFSGAVSYVFRYSPFDFIFNIIVSFCNFGYLLQVDKFRRVYPPQWGLFLFLIVVFGILLKFARKLDCREKYFTIFLNIFSVAIFLFCFLSSFGELSARLFMLFFPSILLLLPMLFKNVIRELHDSCLKVLFFIFCFSYIIRMSTNYRQVIWKYENILWGEFTSADDRRYEITEEITEIERNLL